ncbi:MAG: thiamine phosphate synthase [Chloroflexota bacterium]|nr:thiamine phosphate synthase [Chloroflexota bacterium]
MTTPISVPDLLFNTFLGGILNLTYSESPLEGDGQCVSRLKEIVMELPGKIEIFDSPLSLGAALSLADSTLVSLETITALGGSDLIPAESAAELSSLLAELSAQLGAALRQQKADSVRGLYVIIDPEVTGGREPLEIAQAAVRGGARMLQLRDKLRDKGEILPLAQDLQALCEASDVLLIVNDHVDLAAAVGSGGVHVGQTDLPVAQARQVLGPEQVLGRSNREIHLLVESQEMGADHVAFGAIYQTTTKSGGRGPQGPERLKEAREVTHVPLVAIGGINAANVGPVIEYGADAVCVTAAVGLAPEPEAAAAEMVEAIRQAGGKV